MEKIQNELIEYARELIKFGYNPTQVESMTIARAYRNYMRQIEEIAVRRSGTVTQAFTDIIEHVAYNCYDKPINK